MLYVNYQFILFIKKRDSVMLVKEQANRWMDHYRKLPDWKQARSPSAGTEINKLWHVHMMDIIQQYEMSCQSTEARGGTLKAYSQVKEATLKGCILYDYKCMAFLKRQSYRHSKNIYGYLGRIKGIINRRIFIHLYKMFILGW